MTAKKGVFAYQ